MSDANGSNRVAEAMAGKPETAGERLAFMLQQQQLDQRNLETLRRQTKQVRQNLLVRAGRIDELKRIVAAEAKPEAPRG